MRKGSGDEGKLVTMKGSDDVARALLWGGSRSTKPCVFPCKVAAADDERCLCDGCGCGRFVRELFLLCVLQEGEWRGRELATMKGSGA